ncbi:response regulator [Azospirillum sp. TSO35-2]|uniref:response regulator n=1 Tax=Azospirillum sp. TSO35-2 TaxID=716796 RepID=UPI000D605F5A|nr:response regulator [Azospirillum sp. TSO35-2]PWC32660.1 regulator [Azospirillum sp. TSO35-2]
MPADQTGGSPPLRILLAEDEAVTRIAARVLLERAGHRVVAVEDGPAAVAAAITGDAGAPFDLILMDLGLPGLDGDEAVRTIRRQRSGAPGGTPPRILMLTASATTDGMVRCTGCGADGVLLKPLRLDALATALTAAAPAVPAAMEDGGAFDHTAVATMRELLPAARAAELLDKTGAALRQHHAALQAAMEAGDTATAAAMAHKIAGVSGQYGCLALRREARSLEACLEHGSADRPQRVRALTDAIAPALAFLERCAAQARG